MKFEYLVGHDGFKPPETLTTYLITCWPCEYASLKHLDGKNFNVGKKTWTIVFKSEQRHHIVKPDQLVLGLKFGNPEPVKIAPAKLKKVLRAAKQFISSQLSPSEELEETKKKLQAYEKLGTLEELETKLKKLGQCYAAPETI